MLELPFDSNDVNIQLIDISALRISFVSPCRFFDIGSLLYTDKKTESFIRYRRQGIYHSRYAVNPDSYRESRKIPIERYIENLFIEAKKGLSSISHEGKVRTIMRFMGWCDDAEQENCLDDFKKAKKTFRAYIRKLEHENKIYDAEKKIGLCTRSAVLYQNTVKNFLAIALNIQSNYLEEGIRLLKNDESSSNHVFAPEHATVGRNLALWSKLFNNLTDFLINEKKYPFQLSLPEENVWLIPSEIPFLTKYQRNTNRRIFFGFDRDSGRLLEGHEMKSLYGYTLSTANQQVKHSKQRLITANNDLRCPSRYRLGKIAHDAFFMMFMLFTRTRSEIRHIKMEEVSIGSLGVAGFKIIKARANNKICEYQVTTRFMKEFKKFLKLRDWLMDGESFDYLFFHIDKNARVIKARKETAVIFNRVIHSLIHSEFSVLTPSQCRVAGADHIVNKYDIETAAVMLQNRPSTLKKHYANGNHHRTSQQFTDFFVRLRERVICIDKDSNHINVPSGHCVQFNAEQAEVNAPIDVDCRIPQGCLFCENYTVHADEVDIRKLLSLEFVIKETKRLAHDIEHFESTSGLLLGRIREILNELEKINDTTRSLIMTLRKEVYEQENLSRYWDNKLSQLVNMGIL